MSGTIVLTSLLVAAPAAFASESDPGSTGSTDAPGAITASDVPAGSTDIPDGAPTEPVHIESDGFDDAAKLAVSGTLGVMAVDGSAAHVDEATGDVTPGSPSSYRYSVALDDGTSVSIEGDLHESLPTGSRFTGTVAIPDAVDTALPESARGPVSRSSDAPIDALSSTGADVLAAAETAETPLPIVQADIVPLQAKSAPQPGQHVLFAVVKPAGSSVSNDFYTDANVDTLWHRLGAYWNKQTLDSNPMPYGADTLHYTSAYSGCSDAAVDGMWNEALSKFGMGSNWQSTFFYGNTVIVLTPDQHCDSIGVATVGSGLKGGGIIRSTVGIGLDLATLAHEYGHTIGLGHSNTYGCDDPAFVEDVGAAGDCWTQEYGDIYDVMGAGFCTTVKCWDQPGALNVVDRLNLGVMSVQTYSLSPDQQTQSWTIPINPAGGDAFSSRGAAVVDPLTGYYYFIEYRSGTLDDSGTYYATQPPTSAYRPGVRISYGGDEAQSYTQEVMPATSDPSFRSFALQQGDTFGSQAGGLTVSFSSVDYLNTAYVTVTARNAPTLTPALTGPALAGGTAIGSTLSVASNNWNVPGLSYTYSWQRNGSPISGASSSSYTTTAQDEGYRITASVTASRSGYWSGQATTNAITVDSRAHQFTDVLPPDLFFAETEWMSTSGISQGYDNGDGTKSYHPLEDVSRQAMAAFLYRYSGESFTPPATPSFSDVPQSHPFYTAIEWMKARGISTGNADGTYAPLDPVSRQAMAAFLARLSGDQMPVVSTPTFSDVPNSNPFAAQVKWMKDSAISTGYPDGTYHPVEAVSRQAMAAFLSRFDKLAD